MNVLEGFAGSGGLSEAAAMLGITDVLGVETNTDACATALAAGHKRLQADIRDLDPDDFPHTTGWLSAPPCPTYCASGKRSGHVNHDLVLDGVRRLGDSMANTGRDEEHRETYRGVADQLPGQTIEMRRSYLAILIALIDDVRACLADIFRAIDLDGRIPDADMLDPVHDGLNTAGEALTEIVTALHNRRQS